MRDSLADPIEDPLLSRLIVSPCCKGKDGSVGVDIANSASCGWRNCLLASNAGVLAGLFPGLGVLKSLRWPGMKVEGGLDSPSSRDVACDRGLPNVCFGVVTEPDDIGLVATPSPSSGREGVLALASTLLVFAYGVVVLGPRLIIGLMTLVPPLVLRCTPEPAVEVGVGGI